MNDLGQYLKAGREKAGLTLEEVAKTTRIQPKFLEALEEGRLDDLPAPAIARGFVIAYCRAVGAEEGPALAFLTEYFRQRKMPSPVVTKRPLLDLQDMVLRKDQNPGINWTYVAILIVFMVGILVAILTVGTGPGLEDVSRVLEVPKVQNLDLPPHG